MDIQLTLLFQSATPTYNYTTVARATFHASMWV